MNLKDMRIGVVGGGVVGRATSRVWLEHVKEVRVWDVVKERRTCGRLEEALGSDIVFICLPENCVEHFFRVVTDEAYSTVWRGTDYVLKSTVPIGTTRQLAEQHRLPNLVHSPEFLTERCAVEDAQMPARHVIGTVGGEGGLVHLLPTGLPRLLHCMLVTRFPGVPTYWMSSDESEAVKLLTNAAFAVKVALWNEFRSLCDRLGLDWSAVREGVLSDGRIGSSHTQVPGHGGFGFGGRCLPKDLEMLRRCFVGAGQDDPMLRAAAERNALDRAKSTTPSGPSFQEESCP